jgi:hypothetical protein
MLAWMNPSYLDKMTPIPTVPLNPYIVLRFRLVVCDARMDESFIP